MESILSIFVSMSIAIFLPLFLSTAIFILSIFAGMYEKPIVNSVYIVRLLDIIRNENATGVKLSTGMA